MCGCGQVLGWKIDIQERRGKRQEVEQQMQALTAARNAH